MGKVWTPEHQHPRAYDHQHYPAHGLEVVKTKIQTQTDYYISDVTSYTKICAVQLHWSLFWKKLYEIMFISYLFREGVGCQITPTGCPVLYPWDWTG